MDMRLSKSLIGMVARERMLRLMAILPGGALCRR